MTTQSKLELKDADDFTNCLARNRKKLKDTDFDFLETICKTFIDLFEKENPKLLEPSEEFNGLSEFEYYLEAVNYARQSAKYL